ncbi:bifunctional arginine demethylase and lysyl-hydroxylase JMJD6-like [Styela clava]|uniref:bifunctional arginine demethylase and lysyl-hydroxylase JMJD6-like n=1 Tax=Styela clava TaxID=7725 RepID=UPI00193980FE|nr:bifunctional arginine demethylase and lysyl-hydroxylase JMJD6-like [Styela clava]
MDVSEEKVEVLPGDFEALLKKAIDELGISEETFSSLSSIKAIKNEGKSWRQKHGGILVAGFVFLALVLAPTLLYQSASSGSKFASHIFNGYFSIMGKEINEEMCVLPHTEWSQDPFRPPVNCTECANVSGIHKVTGLTHAEFLEKYAFSMQPVLIKDGQDGWTARNHFSFEFFRDVYKEGSKALEKVKNDCQFFPYQTEFADLGEMLNMTSARAEGKEKPWYVGWSNCDGKAANILRKHYKFPYFLPPELDHSKTDWIFMGLPGYGANIHIDAVGTLSWQAQVKGVKKWILEAPPECAGICVSSMEIIVEPGDIIVLDTNKWFHGTLILGNETSIVIGSEYY